MKSAQAGSVRTGPISLLKFNRENRVKQIIINAFKTVERIFPKEIWKFEICSKPK